MTKGNTPGQVWVGLSAILICCADIAQPELLVPGFFLTPQAWYRYTNVCEKQTLVRLSHTYCT